MLCFVPVVSMIEHWIVSRSSLLLCDALALCWQRCLFVPAYCLARCASSSTRLAFWLDLDPEVTPATSMDVVHNMSPLGLPSLVVASAESRGVLFFSAVLGVGPVQAKPKLPEYQLS